MIFGFYYRAHRARLQKTSSHCGRGRWPRLYRMSCGFGITAPVHSKSTGLLAFFVTEQTPEDISGPARIKLIFLFKSFLQTY